MDRMEESLSNLHELLRSIHRGPTEAGSSSTHDDTTANHVEVSRESDIFFEQVDVMGAVIFEDETESWYFGNCRLFTRLTIKRLMAHTGSTSNTALLRRLSQLTLDAVSVREPSVRLDWERENATALFNFYKPVTPPHADRPQSSLIEPSLFTLPPDDEAQALIAAFFSNTGYLFPLLHERLFLDRYNLVRRSAVSTATRSWLGLLNIVFAMAISTTADSSQSAPKRAERSDVYYQRAFGFCNGDVLKGANIDVGKCSTISLVD